MFSTDEQTARLQKREALIAESLQPYPSSSLRTHEIHDLVGDFDAYVSSKEKVIVAGRVLALRAHGGSLFATVRDFSGALQIFFSKKDVGEKEYERISNFLDAGDFIEVKGIAFTTTRGEKSIFADSWRMLAKALTPLPEKWHGLSDIETRFRKRYLDLLMNAGAMDRLVKRTAIISAIRAFFDKEKFIEVETPTLQPLYGGGFARPFVTHHHALATDFYLRISDELYLKRLLVGGFEKVYEITKVFRNEGIDHDHNPEFTMCEAQIAYKDYTWGMDFFENLCVNAAKTAIGTTEFSQGDTSISLKQPWKRMSVVQSLKEIAHINTKDWNDRESANKIIAPHLKSAAKKMELTKLKTIGECIAFAFEECVEDKLLQPTIIFDYPIEVSPLAKKCATDPRFAERFEVFARGMEIGNNYSELNDPVDLAARFIEEKEKEAAGFEEAHQSDIDFLESIRHGMPPSCGIGIGIDRLVMLLTGSSSIKEVIFFPTLRPRA